jgi:hypothetical protein
MAFLVTPYHQICVNKIDISFREFSLRKPPYLSQNCQGSKIFLVNSVKNSGIIVRTPFPPILAPCGVTLRGNEALKERNEALKERNEALKERNEALKERNGALKERSVGLKNLSVVAETLKKLPRKGKESIK